MFFGIFSLLIIFVEYIIPYSLSFNIAYNFWHTIQSNSICLCNFFAFKFRKSLPSRNKVLLYPDFLLYYFIFNIKLFDHIECL